METSFLLLYMVNRLFTVLLMLGLCSSPVWGASASEVGADPSSNTFLARLNPSPKKQLHDCYKVEDKDEARSCIQQVRRRGESRPVDLRTRSFQTSTLPKNTRKDATSLHSRRATHCLALKNTAEREECAKNASMQKQSRRTTIIHKGIPIFLPKDQCGGLKGQERAACVRKRKVPLRASKPPESARILKMKAQNIDR